MVKMSRFYVATQEGRELFHISAGIDGSLRKTAIRAMRGQAKHEDYLYLMDLAANAHERYRDFLDNAYVQVRPETDNDKKGHMSFPHFKGILHEIRNQGQIYRAQISTDLGGDYFRLIKQTDVCIAILERFGLTGTVRRLEMAVALRKDFKEEIQILREVMGEAQQIAARGITP